MADSGKQNDRIESLLTELLDPRNATAWRSFLGQYGSVMMSVASQHALDPHDAQDCFIYICEKLCEDGCRRLRSFSPSRGGTFQTWLHAIASNLCTDWSRFRYGRPGTPTAIQALSALEQLVFELSVVEGLDRESCLIGVRHRFPKTSRSQLSDALAAVHTALTSRQRWKYTVFRQRNRVLPTEPGRRAVDAGEENHPLDHTSMHEKQARLEAALTLLTARQRLMLRLRYEQEMTLEEVATVVGLKDLHQARRFIQAALHELSELLRKTDFL